MECVDKMKRLKVDILAKSELKGPGCNSLVRMSACLFADTIKWRSVKKDWDQEWTDGGYELKFESNEEIDEGGYQPKLTEAQRRESNSTETRNRHAKTSFASDIYHIESFN